MDIIVGITGMETRDGHRYCRVYWNGDTRCAQVLWRLLEWRHEVGTGIVDVTGMETGDVANIVEFIWDGDRRWAQVL